MLILLVIGIAFRSKGSSLCSYKPAQASWLYSSPRPRHRLLLSVGRGRRLKAYKLEAAHRHKPPAGIDNRVAVVPSLREHLFLYEHRLLPFDLNANTPSDRNSI